MVKLGLIGKKLAHSKSEQVYRELLDLEFTYDLLEYSNENHIPQAQKLLANYDGLSITSPYKKHFLEQVILDDKIKSLKAINCLYKKDGKIYGANTDYEAIKILIGNYTLKNVAILGDGAMSFLCQKILIEKEISFEIFSRKSLGDISNLDLTKYSLVINCCSRDYSFAGTVSNETTFWDLNYSMTHQASFALYEDGLELLKLQAKLALKYWGF